MSLSSDLISQFVKATKDETPKNSEATVQGTTVEYNGSIYVKLDGSDQLTPITTTTDTKPGERVTVLIKDHTATVTGNMSSPSARTDDVKEIGNQITQVEILVADKVSTGELEAEKARIEELRAENVTIKGQLTANNADILNLKAQDATITGKLTAAEADISNIQTTKLDAEIADVKYATVENLNVTNANVHNLEATYGEFADLTADKLEATEADISRLEADKASISDLNAAQAHINELDANVADIDTLIFDFASGTSIQTSFANAVIAQLGNAQIKSAMIKDISADKITAGDISTNNVRVVSDDGKLIISDETIQISDENRVRVQIGKDASNDYSVNVWDADGNLMFSKGGITDAAIKEAIIRDDMVTDDANISASKLNINSLFTEINNSAHTIKSTKVYLDEENQTLDVAFGAMTTDVDSVKSSVSSQGTQISTIQGQISSKIWQQDIETAVDGLEIGGRNLLPNTKSMTGYAAPSSVTYAQDSEGFTVASWSAVDTLDWRGLRVYEPIPFSLVRNKEVTVSLWVKTTDPEAYNSETNRGLSISFYLCPADSRTPGLYKLNPHYDTVLTDEWQKISITRTLEDAYFTSGTGTIEDDTRLYVQIYNYSLHPMDVRKIKMEFGNVATDWSPAPEDVEGELRSLSTQYSSLDQTVDSVSVTVGQHATQLGAVENRTSELEINLNGVRTTVSSLKVGGRNLILDSEDEVSFKNTLKHFTLSEYGVEKAKNTKVTMSFDARTDEPGVGCDFYMRYVDGTAGKGVGFSAANGLTAGYQRFTATIEVGDYDFTMFTIRSTTANTATNPSATATIFVKNVKVELGTMASDWTPAPEDMAKTTDLDSYATKTEIEQTAEDITSTVEATYATKGDLSTTDNKIDSLEIGGRNLLFNTKSMEGYSKHSSVTITDDEDGYAVASYSAVEELAWRHVNAYDPILFSTVRGKTVTVSLEAKTTDPDAYNADTTHGLVIAFNLCAADSTSRQKYRVAMLYTTELSEEWQKISITRTLTDAFFSSGSGDIDDNTRMYINVYDYSLYPMDVRKFKMEFGNKATDWSPAPEDIDSAVDKAKQDSVKHTDDQVKEISTQIKQLKNSLQWLIRGEDGNSAMYFDEEKQVYTFSAQPMLEAIGKLGIDMKDAIDLITGDGGVDERLSALRNELDGMVEYVKTGRYNGQPCIELGELDTGFKLRITNTELQFVDGTVIPAYISNKKLMIEIAEVKKELQFDGFVWKKRVNSVTGLHHLGLLWKGVSS